MGWRWRVAVHCRRLVSYCHNTAMHGLAFGDAFVFGRQSEADTDTKDRSNVAACCAHTDASETVFVLATRSGNVFALDTDSGATPWKRDLLVVRVLLFVRAGEDALVATVCAEAGRFVAVHLLYGETGGILQTKSFAVASADYLDVRLVPGGHRGTSRLMILDRHLRAFECQELALKFGSDELDAISDVGTDAISDAKSDAISDAISDQPPNQTTQTSDVSSEKYPLIMLQHLDNRVITGYSMSAPGIQLRVLWRKNVGQVAAVAWRAFHTGVGSRARVLWNRSVLMKHIDANLVLFYHARRRGLSQRPRAGQEHARRPRPAHHRRADGQRVRLGSGPHCARALAVGR